MEVVAETSPTGEGVVVNCSLYLGLKHHGNLSHQRQSSAFGAPMKEVTTTRPLLFTNPRKVILPAPRE